MKREEGEKRKKQQGRHYICIDLKSFYASVECVERNLDPFTTNLVVADPDRSRCTICLAITPAMKKLGIRNRCRINEIPAGISYITARPRMQLYIDYSAAIYGIYLRYLAAEDIHVYSIDECFMDVTAYLELYKMTPEEFARFLMDEVKKETGITATAGVGTNLYLAKIAMDIVAKRTQSHIGILDEMDYRRLLWEHTPLRDFWRIGSRTERRLAGYGIHTMGDIARMSLVSEDWLYRLFGIDAELLIDHAWGIEPCRMEDIKNYSSKEHSLTQGQVLMRTYSFEEARVVVREMTDLLSLDMARKGVVAESFTLWVIYDHRTGLPGSGGTERLLGASNSSRKMIDAVTRIYDRVTIRHAGIRRIHITANRITAEVCEQLDFFSDPVYSRKEKNLQKAILSSQKRYGKNAIVRGCNLLECSTLIMRNGQIGGHHA